MAPQIRPVIKGLGSATVSLPHKPMAVGVINVVHCNTDNIQTVMTATATGLPHPAMRKRRSASTAGEGELEFAAKGKLKILSWEKPVNL